MMLEILAIFNDIETKASGNLLNNIDDFIQLFGELKEHTKINTPKWK